MIICISLILLGIYLINYQQIIYGFHNRSNIKICLPAVPIFNIEISPKYDPDFRVANTVLPASSATTSNRPLVQIYISFPTSPRKETNTFHIIGGTNYLIHIDSKYFDTAYLFYKCNLLEKRERVWGLTPIHKGTRLLYFERSQPFWACPNERELRSPLWACLQS